MSGRAFSLALMLSLLCGLGLTYAIADAHAKQTQATGGSAVTRELVRMGSERDQALIELHQAKAVIAEQGQQLEALGKSRELALSAANAALQGCY